MSSSSSSNSDTSETLEAPLLELTRRKDDVKSTRSELIHFALLGTASWFVANAISSQLPVFTSCRSQTFADDSGRKRCVLPEGVQFSAYVNIASQLGNIVPLIYKTADRALGSSSSGRRLSYAIVVALVAGLAISVLAAFTWSDTMRVAGKERSAYLIFYCFVAGGAGCLCSIVVWQFSAQFPAACVQSLSIGMACGGLVPMLLAVVQNSGFDDDDDDDDAPSFDPQWVFLATGCVQLFFIWSFVRIWQRRNERCLNDESGERSPDDDVPSATRDLHFGTRSRSCCCYDYEIAIFAIYFAAYSLPSFVPIMIEGYAYTKALYAAINVAYTLGDVVGRSSTHLSAKPRRAHLVVLTLATLALYALQVFAALFHGSVSEVLPGYGGYAFVPLQFLFYVLRGFAVTSMYCKVKRESPSTTHAMHRTGRLGVAGQCGSALGALVAFVLITATHVVG